MGTISLIGATFFHPFITAVNALGEARKRKISRAKLLEGRFCVFCGGVRPAVQVDHVPPKIMFANKQRPKGLEFPSCADCNQGTKDFDQIAAFFSRLTLSETPADEQSDLEKLVRAFRNNYPKVINDINFGRLGAVMRKRAGRQFPNTSDTSVQTGPIIGAVMTKFGSKVGFGLHYLSTGRIVSNSGAAAVWLLTNAQLVSGDFPAELVNSFPEFQTLRQGQQHTLDQFGYSSLKADADGVSAHIIYFRLSFFLAVLVAERDAERLSSAIPHDLGQRGKPGDWKIPYSLR